MKCVDKELAELLPWYLNRTLTNEEEGKMRNHLNECSKCAGDLEKMKWLSAGFETNVKAQHVLPELLVVYAEAKAELPGGSVLRIEKHLESCADCQRELQILEKVNQSLKPTRERPWLEAIGWRLREIFPEFLTRPALAYVIILLLLYPAWRGIFEVRQEIRKMQEPKVAQINYELAQFDARSGVKVENEIKITPQTEVFSLSFSIPILTAENIRYDAEILDIHNQTIWQKTNIKSLDKYGSFLLICHSKFFPEGSYTLKIKEVSVREGQVQEEFAFLFKLIQE